MIIATAALILSMGGLFDGVPGCGVTWFLGRLASVVGWAEPAAKEQWPASVNPGGLSAARGLRWEGYGPAGLYVRIDVEHRFLELHMGSESLRRWPVAVGKPSTPTPLGTWLVIDKAIWGGGFGARWNGLSIPWGRYGVHGTNRPGSVGGNLSAGCVRMLNENVIELYRQVPVGTLVVITGRGKEQFGEVPRRVKFLSRGSDVMQLQRILRAENLYSGSVDGIFGAGTLSALREYQQSSGGRGTGDIDRDMWEEMGLGRPGVGSIWFSEQF
ncbi:MAG: L,D-transpeptidase family protein [Bacillota bacterium]